MLSTRGEDIGTKVLNGDTASISTTTATELVRLNMEIVGKDGI